MSLPPSLSAQVLGTILRYVPGQRRKLETALQQEFQDLWEERSLSDHDFYNRLHAFIQYPPHRFRFNEIARKHSSKKRSLALPEAIHAYYVRQQPDILAKLSPQPGPVEILRTLAEEDNIDRLANVAWAFLEGGTVDVTTLHNLSEEDPHLQEAVRNLPMGDTTTSSWHSWQSTITDLNLIVKELDPETANIELANRLLAGARRLHEIAEAERLRFWSELQNLFEEYKDSVAASDELVLIRTRLTEIEQEGSIPVDWNSVLASIREALAQYLKEDERIRKASNKLGLASFRERQEIIEKVTLYHQQQQASINAIRDVVNVIFHGEAEDASSESEEEDNALEQEHTANIIPQTAPGAQLDPSSSENALGKSDADGPVGGQDDESAGTIDIAKLEISSEEEPGHDQEDLSDAHIELADPSTSTQDEDISASNNVPTTPDTRLEPSAAQVLNTLLSKGHFARAYWVARVSRTFDADILGALSEGARVQPGASCHGLLARFLNELTTPRNWTDDEELLLVAAILQPLLFLRPYPEALYQVTSTVPITPLTGFVERFRKTYLSQGITLGPQSVQPNIEVTEVEERLQRLSDDAQDFLTRIPSIRFGYQPAERAFRFLYGHKSGWRRLHELVANGEYGRVTDARVLTGELNPQVVSNVHNQVPGIKQQLVGHARDKLARHLHDTIALAVEWINLLEERGNREQERQERLEQDLKQDVTSELHEMLSTFQDSLEGSAAYAATSHRITDLLTLLKGDFLDVQCIDDACIDLPGVQLDDDMVPPLDDSTALIIAMEKLNTGKSSPKDVFAECLLHYEFVRASRLIERHEFGEDALDDFAQFRDDRRVEIRRRLNDLSSKVEESFLLGQLWDSGEDTQARTDLLSLVDQGLMKLDADDTALNVNVRAASALGNQIDHRMAEVTAKQLSYLQDEKSTLSTRFQETERGQADRLYFETSFVTSLQQEDHITAFDLVDRARRAVNQGQPMDRTALMAQSEHLHRFINFAEESREPLRRGVKQYVDSIRRGETIFGIPFGQIDQVRRDESIAVLNKWAVLSDISEVEEVCRFAGFPIIKGRTRLGKRGGDGLFHAHIELSQAGPISPLPGFGSMLESRIDVVISQRSQEPEQISAFLKEVGGGEGRAVIVLLTRPMSSSYRMKWLQECARQRLMALTLDSCLLMYLSGERNRLQALFDIGLPFTWAQPYITKGETVAREMFVGRSEQAKDIVDRNGSCVVFGGRQLGKSALLTHVRREYHNPKMQEGLFVAYLDVNDLGESQSPDEMMETFWKRVSEHLALVGAIERPAPSNTRRKRSQWREQAPSMIEAALAVDLEKRIVLLLDETDKLLDLDSQSDFALIRRLRILMASTERRFKVVLAGLQSVQRYNNWKNHPFAQLGKEIVIDPLPPKAAEDLIIRPFRALGFEFESAALVCRILSMANYHPGLIQIFCYRLLNSMYKSWPHWKSALRKITSDDMLTIERDPSFREDVRNRFDWTLDLDDRYKVITYGLVLSESPTTAKTAKEFKELGSSWWAGVFDRLEAQDMRALLDEMVGLGVLLAEHHEDLSRQYRLRSPNLLRLLGPKETIEGELLRIVSTDRMTRPNPRDFRSLLEEPGVFGPLTKEQEGYLSETSELFSLVLILGTTAMGLRQVGTQVRQVMQSTVDVMGASWEEITVPTTGGVTTTNVIVDGLKKQLAPRQRRNRYAIVNFEEFVFDEELGQFIRTLIQEMKKLCRASARGKVVIILDPRWAWKWISSDLRATVEEDSAASVMALRRWSEGAVTNALDRVGSRTGSKAAATKIIELTGGIHSPVSQILRRTSRRKSQSSDSVVDIAEKVKNSFLTSDRNTLLSELGVVDSDDPLGNAVSELFRWSEERRGLRILTEDCFSVALDAFDHATVSHRLLSLERPALEEWLRSLAIIWPGGPEDSESVVCPLIFTLLES